MHHHLEIQLLLNNDITIMFLYIVSITPKGKSHCQDHDSKYGQVTLGIFSFCSIEETQLAEKSF